MVHLKVTSEAQLEEMKQRIEEERKKLKEEKNMKEEERKKVKEQVMKQENELKAAQDEHNAVKAKLAALERKIIVGGLVEYILSTCIMSKFHKF